MKLFHHDDLNRIGERVSYGEAGEPFGFSERDRLYHTHVIGKTGAGKSTLLANMAIEDIRQGRGVAVIDPHGALAEYILDRVPKERTHHVLYFNPQDEAWPVALNTLSAGAGERLDGFGASRPHLRVDAVVRALRAFWGDSWGPRMEYILRNAVGALVHAGGQSLLGVMRLLLDRDFRERLIHRTNIPHELRRFWVDVYGSWSARERSEYISPIVNKVGRFSDPPLRAIIGQARPRFSLSRAMDEQKIIIANLAKGAIGGDASNLLGSLLVSMTEHAAFARGEGRAPFFVYIDEFFSFTSEALAAALPELRKFGVGFVLAHQFLDQLSEGLRASVLGSAGNLIAFRVGGKDARVLEEEFAGEVARGQLTDLSNYQAYVRPIVDGEARIAFRTKLYGERFPALGRSRVIIERSRRQFARPAAEAEAKLQRFFDS